MIAKSRIQSDSARLRHPDNKVNNPAFQKWIQDDKETREFFGYSTNSWLDLNLTNANKLTTPTEVLWMVGRSFAIQNNLPYYQQRLIQIYLSAGLHRQDFVPESVTDFLTEIASYPRVLLSFLKPRDRCPEHMAIRERIYGVPRFSISIVDIQDLELLTAQPWIYDSILKVSDHWFTENRFLTIKLALEPRLFADEGSWVRAKKIQIPSLVFATFTLSKNGFGLSYSYSSEYIDEDLAIRFLDLDARLASRKSDNPIRAKRKGYYSPLTHYQGRRNQ